MATSGSLQFSSNEIDFFPYSSAKNSQNLAIPADILFEIFSNLDVPDLLNSEELCGAWQTVLRSRCLWKKLFERKVPRINDFPLNVIISLLLVDQLQFQLVESLESFW